MDNSALPSTPWDAAFWRGTQNVAQLDLLSLVDKFPLSPNESLTFEVLSASRSLLEQTLGTLAVQLFNFEVGPKLYLVPHRLGAFVVAIWPTQFPEIQLLSGTVPASDSRWKKILNRVRRTQGIIQSFLNESDFSKIAENMETLGVAEVVRMSAWRQSEASSLTKSWPERGDGQRFTPLEVISDASAHGDSIRSMQVIVKPGFNSHVRRSSGASFYGGSFRAFASAVLEPLAESAANRVQLLSHRERKMQGELHPVVIRLNGDVFRSAEDTHRLRRHIEQLSEISVGVLHKNPYLHLLVADHRDGSTYDVVVTEPSQITIYPSFASSAQALGRITNELSEQFAGLSIAEPVATRTISILELVDAS